MLLLIVLKYQNLLCFNINIVECKYPLEVIKMWITYRFNINIVECKYNCFSFLY